MAKRYIPSYDEFITESFRDKFREFKDAWSEMRKEMKGEPVPEPVTKEHGKRGTADKGIEHVPAS